MKSKSRKNTTRLNNRNRILQRLENENPLYANTVKETIDKLPLKVFFDKRCHEEYSKRLIHMRNVNGYTQDELAELLEVTHSVIDQHEKCYSNQSSRLDIFRGKKIDKYYLACYSLIYQVSPRYLIGLTDNSADYISGEPFNPMYEEEPNAQMRAKYIIMTLAEHNCDYLMDIIRIADLRMIHKNKIKSLIMSIPKYKDIIQVDVNENDISEYQNFFEEHFADRKFLGTCRSILVTLGTYDFEFLNILACLVKQPEKLRLVLEWINKFGYLTQKCQYRQIDQIENVAKKKFPEIHLKSDMMFGEIRAERENRLKNFIAIDEKEFMPKKENSDDSKSTDTKEESTEAVEESTETVEEPNSAIKKANLEFGRTDSF